MGSQTERNRGVYQGPGLSHLSTDKGGGCRHTRLGTCAWPEPSPLELLPSPSFVSLFRLDRPPPRDWRAGKLRFCPTFRHVWRVRNATSSTVSAPLDSGSVMVSRSITSEA